MTDITASTTEWCGLSSIQTGFANALDAMWATGRLDAVITQLKGEECQGGVIVTGHSLGGALATLVAACAATGEPKMQFGVDYVFTFGAPQISKKPLSLGKAQGGRYFNEDHVSRLMDPVPTLMNSLGGGPWLGDYFHPELECWTLMEASGKIQAVKSASADAIGLPHEKICMTAMISSWYHGTRVPAYLEQLSCLSNGTMSAAIGLHSMESAYIPRLSMLCGDEWQPPC